MAHVGNVVSPQWLHEHLYDAQVVIVDCRFALSAPQQGREQYQTGHIPGAYYLDLNKDLSSPVQTHGDAILCPIRLNLQRSSPRWASPQRP